LKCFIWLLEQTVIIFMQNINRIFLNLYFFTKKGGKTIVHQIRN